jgi:hypothetical protein
MLLVDDAFRPAIRGCDSLAAELIVVRGIPCSQGLVLLIGQLDVANPYTHRRRRDANAPRDLLDRKILRADATFVLVHVRPFSFLKTG